MRRFNRPNRFNRPFRRRGPLGAFLGGMGRGAGMAGANRQLADEARQMLDEANSLFDSGQFAEAADILAQLAEAAQTHNLPQRAGQLRLRAAQAHLQARNAAAAVEHSRAALAAFTQAGMPGRAVALAPRIVEQLRAAGFNAEAEAFAKETHTTLAAPGLGPAPSAAPANAAPTRRPAQQTHCPQCGAALHWLTRMDDEMDCEYCGAVVRAG
ncbi:MAG: hypothetical protein HYZ35_05865 [Chloroflexi bacterium]|nr:hypothetical protein [Chloroflexota bacterium]